MVGCQLKNKRFFASILVGVQFLSLGVLITLLFRYPSHQYQIINGMSVVAGLAIIAMAYLRLKPALQVSPLPKSGAPYITTGIYRFVRHPMYLGVLMIGLGLAGATHVVAGWIIYGVLLIDLNVKARFEDHLLAQIHPEALSHQRHTSRILPCLGGGCRGGCSPT